MTSNRPHRHLELVPSNWAQDMGKSQDGANADALPTALRFLTLLGLRPLDVGKLHGEVSSDSDRSWADFQAAAMWVAMLGDWVLGPICYVQTDRRTLAYLLIYPRGGAATAFVPPSKPPRLAAMLTLVQASPDHGWQVHGLGGGDGATVGGDERVAFSSHSSGISIEKDPSIFVH